MFLTTISITIQALCVLFILIVALYIQDLKRPFASPTLNRMELESILCATITIYCGLFYLSKDLGNTAQLLLFVCILLANGVFLWHWARATIGLYVLMVIQRVPWLRHRVAPLVNGLQDDLGDFNIERKDIHSAEFVEIAELKTIQDLYFLRLNRDLVYFSGAECFEAEEALPNSPNSSFQSLNITANSLEDEMRSLAHKA